MKRHTLVCAALLSLSACGSKNVGTYTLYRSSPMVLGTGARVHVANFNAADGDEYNRSNCTQTAQLWNANLAALHNSEGIGFWCEPGPFSETGSVPTEFDAAFPAQSDSPTAA